MLLALILLPFIGSLVAACLPTTAQRSEVWLAASLSLAGLLITGFLYREVDSGDVIRAQVEWLPQYGLNLVLRMDGLSWLFVLLVQGIGLLVILYARYYLSPEDPAPKFFAFLLAFMGSMLGVVLSGNLIQLVMFWELTSLTSFLLIGYWHHRIDSRRGARMALTVTATGGLCLLAGVLLVGHITGSYDVDEVLASGDAIIEHPYYLPTLLLIALGALTKSAQFPFHFWLPQAMAAPTPVSAYLHSATMVKAGVFLLMLFWPVLSGTPEWFWLIAGAGMCTMLIGAYVAIFQHDLKGLLAYSTISHLGLIMVLLGLGTPLGIVAAIFHTINHAIFKASLFMAVGIIDHETGTRDMRVLRGLAHALPVTVSLALVATASMAGVPLLNGFLSKEMFFAETALVGGSDSWGMSVVALLMGIFAVVYSLRFISVFVGKLAPDLPKEPHEPPRWMRFPVELLVFLCLVVGIVPGWSVGPVLHSAVISVLSERTPAYTLTLWHGFNLPLAMSFVALLGGSLLYFYLRRYFDLRNSERVPLLHHISGPRIFDKILLSLVTLAKFIVHRLGTRSLQPQLLLICVALIAVVLVSMMRLNALPASAALDLSLPALAEMNWLFALMWLGGCACAIGAAWQAKYHRLTALILVGGTGLTTAITFLWLSAPDLALTQLMVETVTTVLILLGLRWLPPRIRAYDPDIQTTSMDRLRRSRDLLIAVSAGLMMAGITYAVLLQPAGNSIADFFLLNAKTGGGGTNVVNVLLVDFRAFDTFGEITVLGIVALTVYALLRRFRPAPDSVVRPPQQTNPIDPAAGQLPAEQADSGYLMIPAVYLRFLLPFMWLAAAYFFMRGHNLPGGGFVAGLIFSVTMIVQYMLAGTMWVESRLWLQPHKWIAWGLATALLAGLGAMALGFPFLTSHTAHVTVPVLGEIHLPSAFVFDLGVFMVVIGTTMLILVVLSHQSIRSYRQPSSVPTTLTIDTGPDNKGGIP